MLSSTRNLMKGPGKYIFVGIVVLAFAVVGVPALSNFGQTKALKVGDQGFTIGEIEQEFNRRFQNIQITSDTAVSREEAIAQGLLQQTISFLTVRSLILQESDKLNLATTDSMIQNYLRTDPGFADPETGEFDSTIIDRILRQNGMSITEFRDAIEVEMLQKQLNDALALNLPAPGALVDFITLRQGEERDVSIASLSTEDAPEMSEQELQAFYETNNARYQDPEYRTYTVVTLSRDVLRPRVNITEEEIQQLYTAREGQLGEPERRSWVQAQFSTTEAAQSVLTAVADGTSFEEAVSTAGGRTSSLTDQARTDLADQTVAEAIFATEAPGLVGPVDGVFGVVIANVTTITPGTETTLEDVRAELEEDLFEDIYRIELDNLYDEIQSAGDAGESLSQAAENVNLEAQRFGPVTRFGETQDDSLFFGDRQLLQEAFTLSQDGFFEEVTLPDGAYAFVQVEDIIPARPIPFEDVRERVQADAKAEASVATLETLAEQVRMRVSNGEDFDAVMTELGGTPTTRTLGLLQNGSDLSPVLIDGIFADAMGTVISAVEEDETLSLAYVTDIRFTSNAQAAMIRDALRGQFGQQMSQNLYASYIAAIEADVGVTTNETALAQRFGTATP